MVTLKENRKMPSFSYSLTGTFHVLAATQDEADLKARGFVLSSLRLFLDTYEHKSVKQEETNETKTTSKSQEPQRLEP